ncbi:MAG TPA: hypothetical protein VMD75_13290 [Candidatus Binataceae bacterium]|nr:hypothetical protein [Candidatus Binataceae bacterium]
MLTLLAALPGCNTSEPLTSLSKGLDPLSSGHNLGPFMGVNFGDLSTDVSARYPQAVAETSPYGAETLRLSDVKSGAVIYKTVLFEFLWHGGGMQLVMVKFEPVYAAAILDDLTHRIGPPALPESMGTSATPEAQWRLADGTSISFNSSLGRLVIVGPSGKILADDIRMREQKGEEFAS